MLFELFLFIDILRLSLAQFGIDNRITEQPEIECLSHDVAVKFATRNAFQGHVFVRGHYNEPECHKDYNTNLANTGFIHVQFDKCGMRRKRSANPRGLSMSATVVISFHRTFITSVDRAYHVQCFYMEADKVLTNSIGVSEIPTQATQFDPVAMPVCTYQVLAESSRGLPINFAAVGDRVYHRWSCQYPIADMYCMRLHTCTVDDGESSIFEVIDRDGCATDRVVLEEIQYVEDLTAGTDAMVFKFADKPRIYFTCQIALTLKNEHINQLCPIPVCSSRRAGRSIRNRRNEPEVKENENFDLTAGPILIIDVDELSSLKKSQLHAEEARQMSLDESSKYMPQPELGGTRDKDGMCLSTPTFGIIMAASVVSTLTAVTFIILYCVKNRVINKT